MPTITTSRPRMPSERELELVTELIGPLTLAAIAVSGSVRRIARFEGEHAPTFEDLGRLYAYVEDATSRLDEARSYIENVQTSLRDLDYVRICGNVNPDSPDPD